MPVKHSYSETLTFTQIVSCIEIVAGDARQTSCSGGACCTCLWTVYSTNSTIVTTNNVDQTAYSHLIAQLMQVWSPFCQWSTCGQKALSFVRIANTFVPSLIPSELGMSSWITHQASWVWMKQISVNKLPIEAPETPSTLEVSETVVQ